MQYPTLSSFKPTVVTNPLGKRFLEKLQSHGEVQINLASGKIISVHLGDYGDISDTGLTVEFANGDCYVIVWNQIEAIWTHRASSE